MLNYAEELRESGMKRNFAGVAWNRFKKEGVDLRLTPSVKEQCAFLLDIADSRYNVKGHLDHLNEYRDFEGRKSVDEVTVSGVCDKLKETQRVCEEGCKAGPTFIVEVIELYQNVVKMKHVSVKLVKRVDNKKGES